MINAQEAMKIYWTEKLQEQEGRFIVAYFDNRWTCAIEWGKESLDSDMIGAAAYGQGETMQEAIDQALNQTGWIKDE
jgi:hypothetical protein